MAKVTSKLQVTLPKALADSYGIKPGHHITWQAAGPVIRVIPGAAGARPLTPAERLRHFDEATARIARRKPSARRERAAGRGWRRADLYERGRSR
jgi:bifunctional DNA-binding transcriptional regulator/antitoxin component of YhaV-PrlF toxin-antitoxin module